jgi:hypothetical protein
MIVFLILIVGPLLKAVASSSPTVLNPVEEIGYPADGGAAPSGNDLTSG